ncbi:MAG: autotransporter domain-containing protein [Zoogloeaceae bacterium]|jgi:hypothetical protein|nr:autotransporter domain-containing protein [Zoogloeaceae bacterium]
MKPQQKPPRVPRLTPIAVALSLVFSGAALATDDWTGATDNDWSTNANWTDGSVPTAADDVTIGGTTNTPEIAAGGDAEASSVEINPDGDSAYAELKVEGSLTVAGDVKVLGGNSNASETAALEVEEGGALAVGGDLTIAKGASGAAIVYVDGTLTVAGETTVTDSRLDIDNDNGYTARATFQDAVTVTGASAQAIIGDNSVVTAEDDFTVSGGAELAVYNGGSLTVVEDDLKITGVGSVLKLGVEETGGSTATSGGAITADILIIENGAGISTDNDSTLNITSNEDGALVLDTATVLEFKDVTVNFTNGGGIEIGANTDTEVTFAANSKLVGAGKITLDSDSDLKVKTQQFSAREVVGATGGGNIEFDIGGGNSAIYGLHTSGNLEVEVASGEVTLSGALGHTGETEVEDGATLKLTGNGNLSASSGVNLNNSGTLDVSGISGNTAIVKNLTAANTSAVTATGAKNLTVLLSSSTSSYSGTITGHGLLTVQSADGVTAQTYTVAGDLGYTGEIAVGPATDLALGASGDISDASGLTLTGTSGNDAKLTVNASTAIVHNLSGNEHSAVDQGSNGLYLANTRDTEFAGAIVGSGNVYQSGDGTLTLSGNSGNGTLLTVGNSSYEGHVALTGAWNGGVAVDGSAGESTFDLGSPDDGIAGVNGGVWVSDGAALNIRGVSGIAGQLITDDGAALNFYVSSNDLQGAPAFLNVSGYSSSSVDAGTLVTINASGSADLTNGFQLVDDASLAADLAAAAANTPITGQLGGSADVVYGIDATGKATVRGVTLKPETKALAEGFLGGVAFLNQGADAAHGEGIHRAVAATSRANAGVSFAAIGGGSVKHETGSHVDVDGYNLIAGIAKGFSLDAGKLTAGVFFEYGDGDYTSHNSFNTGKVKGKGDTDYTGGGFLARFDFSGGAYVEGTARLGKADTDFKSVSLGGAKYDVSSNYYGLSVGGGYLARLGASGELDVYGRYAYSQQKGDKDRLLTGERLKFDAVESQRLRLGARYANAFTEAAKGYVGLAWEHEFDGKANAKLNVAGFERKLDAPELKGSSGIAEVGFTLTPAANKNIVVDIGLQGYFGKREGTTGSAQLKYEF